MPLLVFAGNLRGVALADEANFPLRFEGGRLEVCGTLGVAEGETSLGPTIDEMLHTDISLRSISKDCAKVSSGTIVLPRLSMD
jgi:hypothetical protein